MTNHSVAYAYIYINITWEAVDRFKVFSSYEFATLKILMSYQTLALSSSSIGVEDNHLLWNYYSLVALISFLDDDYMKEASRCRKMIRIATPDKEIPSLLLLVRWCTREQCCLSLTHNLHYLMDDAYDMRLHIWYRVGFSLYLTSLTSIMFRHISPEPKWRLGWWINGMISCHRFICYVFMFFVNVQPMVLV